MKRVDLYTVIHKAQRVHMFELSAKIGRLDFGDEQAVGEMNDELRHFVTHIREHGHHEDIFIHPLFRELGNEAVVLDEEHDDLDKELDQLETILDQKNWQQLYPAFNRFIAIYLLHQDEEESLQASVLWKHFDDGRLLGAFGAFKASRSPSQHAEDLKFILPGLSTLEIAEIFRSIKASSLEAFQSALKMAEKQLEPRGFAALARALGCT